MKSTIKDLYELMSHMQFELCCERAMRQVESSTKEQFLRLTNVNYINLLIEEKNYFLQFSYIPTQKCNNNSIIQEIDKDLIDKNNLSPKMCSYPFPLFQQLIDKLLENDGQKLKNKQIQYYLTYSIFPALTSYYTIDFTANNFSQFNNDFKNHDYNGCIQYLVNKVKTTHDQNCQLLIDLFMIPMFSSPNFVRFITETFQPSFSLLQDQLEDTEIDESTLFIDAIDRINKEMSKNLHLVPSFLAFTIQLFDHPEEIIERCFLSIALDTPEQSIAYGLFHFSKKPEIELLTKIKHLIFQNRSLIDTMLTSFSQLLVFRKMMTTKNEENPDNGSSYDLLLCSEKEKEECSLLKRESLCYFNEYLFQKKEFKGLFQTFILSRVDINIINYITNCDGDVPFKLESNEDSHQYKFYPFFLHFPNDDLKDYNSSDNFDISKIGSIGDIDRYDDISIPSLRHLLQNSDPLPQFVDESFIKDLTVENFLMNYLVMRGDAALISSRLKYYHNITNCLKDKSEDEKIKELMSILPKTLLQITYEIEILTVASLIEQRNENIKSIILYFTSNQLNILSKIISLDKAKVASKVITKNKIDYIENDRLLLEIFEANIQKIFGKKQNNSNDNRNYENIYILLKMIEKKKTSIFSKDNNNLFVTLKSYLVKKQSDVIQLDLQLKDAITNHFDELIDFSIRCQFSKEQPIKTDTNKKDDNENDDQNGQINGQIKFNKKQFFVDKLIKLNQVNYDLLALVQESLLESSIFRKFEIFCNFFVKVKLFILDGYPKDEELGSDELTSILSIVILMSRSPNLHLNIEFIKMFIPLYEYCFIDMYNEFRYYLEAAKTIFNSFCSRKSDGYYLV